MRIRFILPLAALLAAVPAAAQPAHTFRSDWHRFTLQVPEAWRQMPDTALLGYEQDALVRTGMSVDYEAGFRIGEGGGWRTPPISLLQVVPNGHRMTPEDFQAEFTSGQAYQAMLGAVRAAELAGARLEPPLWDDENGLAWFRSFFGTTSDPLYGFTVVALNGAGTATVWLNYYTKSADDVAAVRAELLGIMKSLRFDAPAAEGS